MNCDQAFDCLTTRSGRDSDELRRHLAQCPRCRDMAEVLEPALDLFDEVCEPAHLDAQAAAAHAEPASQRPVRGPLAGHWSSSAPWQEKTRSAMRIRRDGLRVAGVIAFVALLTAAVVHVASDDPSGIGIESTALGDDCIREATDVGSPETAISGCVSCHLQLQPTDERITADAHSRASRLILKCVDCHLDATDQDIHVASSTGTALLCLFPHHDG